MSSSFALSTVGIKDPPQIRPDRSRPSGPTARAPRRASAPVPGGSPRPRRVLAPKPIIEEPKNVPTSKSARRSAVRLESDVAAKLGVTANAAGVSVSALAVAALERGLAQAPEALRVQDRRRDSDRSISGGSKRPHRSRTLAEKGTRPPAAASQTTKSDLINEAIRRGLPENPRLALASVIVSVTRPGAKST